MSQKRILIVDDFEDNCKMLCEILGDTYECAYTSNSIDAYKMIQDYKPNLILLDYKMPGIEGLEVCRMVRQNEATKNTPVVFVSGAATIEERIKALEMGADDFIPKPFHVKELLLRVSARMADKKEQQPQAVLNAANLKMDLLSRQIFVAGEEIQLTPKQFEILRLLIEDKNKLVTREHFLKEVWGDIEVTSRNVDSQINYLKKKLEKFDGKFIAVPSMGYRLEIE